MSATEVQRPEGVRSSPDSTNTLPIIRGANPSSQATSTPPTARISMSEPQAGANNFTKLQTATLMSSLCACVFISALDITIVTTAMPAIAHQFASQAGYTWIGTSFTLAHTASTPSWGKVSDIWGRKPVLLCANVVFFAGSLVCALVNDMDAFIAGRALQGLGAGGMQTIVNICISDIFSPRDRGLYYGLTSVVWALACGVGPVMGGVFTSELSWRWCFWINLPVTGAALVLLLFTFDLPNPRTPFIAGVRALDWTGSLLIVGGALMLLIGLYLGGVYEPWHSAAVVCLIVFGFVASGLFVLNEWKLARYPLLPMLLFRTWSSAAAYLVCFMNAFAYMGVAYYLPLYFQSVLLATPIMSGVYMLPFVVSSSVAGAFTGVYIRWSGTYLAPLYCGMAAMTLGIGLLIDIGVGPNWVKLAIYQLIGGAGFGMSLEGPLLAVQTEIPERHVASATAAMGFVRSISAAISIVIGGVVFQNEMARRSSVLRDQLSPNVTRLLDGRNAAANIDVVATLPPDQQMVARQAFYESTRSIWILYVCFSAVGLLLTFLIHGNHLSKEHEVTQVGLDNLGENTETYNTAAEPHTLRDPMRRRVPRG